MNAENIQGQLRSFLRRLARGRKYPAVNAADAQRFFDTFYPQLKGDARTSYINWYFNRNNEEIAPVGQVCSKHPQAKSRRITQWEVRDYA